MNIKHLTVFFIAFIILVILAANLGLGPLLFPFVSSVPGSDKILHLLMMGILSFLVNAVLSGSKVQIFKASLLKGSLIVLIVVTIEEVSQLFLQYRTFTITDLLFDYIGIVLFGRLADRIIRRNYPAPIEQNK
ncbi:MAG: VanZ family protein [Anaerolineales bacterium]|nr:VanZ family protein [Anaerolineales bacterium]